MSFLANWSLLLIPVPVLPTLGAAASLIERNLSCKSCTHLFLWFSWSDSLAWSASNYSTYTYLFKKHSVIFLNRKAANGVCVQDEDSQRELLEEDPC